MLFFCFSNNFSRYFFEKSPLLIHLSDNKISLGLFEKSEENKKGVLLFYKSKINPFSIKELFYELKFALSIPLKNVLYSLQRESFIKKHRVYSNYIYCWFLGVEKGGENAVYELKNKIFELSKKENLPILIETSVEKNKIIYQRYGFEIYFSWFDEKNNITLWFMKRENN